MNHFKIILFILFFGLSLPQLKAQDLFKGLLLDKTTKEPIEGSHIINLSKKTLAISDQKGRFRILVQSFDTLLISNVNYERQHFVINEVAPTLIYLSPLIIQLEEVEVRNIVRNANIFRENLKKMEERAKKYKIYGLPGAQPMAEIPPLFQEDNSLRFWENGRILPPSTIDIYLIPKLFSRKYKAKMKYYALQAGKDENRKNGERFNREIVRRVVGLEGDLLTDFISFMEVNNNFVSESTDYEIVVFIKERYSEFMSFGE